MFDNYRCSGNTGWLGCLFFTNTLRFAGYSLYCNYPICRSSVTKMEFCLHGGIVADRRLLEKGGNMYRTGLLGLYVLVLCSSLAQGQMMPGQGQGPAAYVLSEQVTCTCGHVSENYVGGPRHCNGCGQALPAAPTAAGSAIAPVNYQESSDFGEYAYEQPMDGGYYGGDGYSMGDCGSSCQPCDQGNVCSFFHAIWNSPCFQGDACSTSLCGSLKYAPPMIGGGFGGSGMVRFQGSQIVSVGTTAIGNVVVNNGVNSSILYDSALTPITNPDFAAVGIGSLTDRYRFNVVESVPGANVGLPPGVTFLNAIASETESLGLITNAETWAIAINGTQAFSLMIPDAANAGAAVVGRTRIADNNSPMPRTRMYLNYDMLANVPLNAGGVNVNRFTPGMEFAFGKNNHSSLEFRVPYAITMSSNVRIGGESTTGAAELGDLFLAYKKVLKQSTDYLISGGVAVTLPSASDLTLSLVDGSTAMLVENQSLHIMPFMSGMAQWTDRVFTQSFIQVDVDANGNQVYVNNASPNLASLGRLRDTTRLYTDSSIGYWIRKPGEACDAFFRSIAPALELHYERQLQKSDSLVAPGFVLGTQADGYQTSLMMTAGSTFELQRGGAISLGYSFPIGNSADQMSDGQLRVLLNRYF